MWTTKTAVEDAGKRTLWPTAVGTGMTTAVIRHKVEQMPQTTFLPSVSIKPCITEYQHHCRETSGDEVKHIVYPSRPATEQTITLRTVTYHAVKRVDHLVGHHTRHSQQQEPKQGSNHAIAQILGQGLQSGGTHFLLRQLRCVPAHYPSNLTTTFLQRFIHSDKHIPNFLA